MRHYLRHWSPSLVIILALAMPAFAKTQLEMNQDSQHSFEQADRILNETYLSVRKSYAHDALFLAKLQKAQRAWLAYRDAQIEAHYPLAKGESSLHKYGSIHPMCYSGLKTQLTQERTAYLKQWLDGAQEGDVCSGSIRIQQ